MATLRSHQDDSASRLEALASEHNAAKADLQRSSSSLTQMQVRVDASEQDLVRIRQSLAEWQSSHVAEKKEKEAHEAEAQKLAAKQQLLQEELRQVSSALEAAMRNEVALTQQLELATVRHQEDRVRVQEELAALKQAHKRDIVEADARAERVRAQHNQQVEALEARQQEELGRSQSLVHENDQLRRFLAEYRQSSTFGMSSLHSQLENHILRLQQHTNELRDDLARSPAVPAVHSPAATARGRSSSPRSPIPAVGARSGDGGLVQRLGSQALCEQPASYLGAVAKDGAPGSAAFPGVGAF